MARGITTPETRAARETVPASSQDTRQPAAEALARSLAGSGGPEGILRLLSHPDPDVREIGLNNLPALSDQAAFLRPRLIELLRHDRPGVRGTAARGLGLLGPGDADTFDALRSRLNDVVPVAEDAIWALGRLGSPAGGREAAVLVGLLPSKSLVIRNRVLGSLSAFSPLDPSLYSRVLTVLPGVFSASWEGDDGTDVLLARLCQRNPGLQHEVMLALLRGTEEQRRGAVRTLGRLDQPSPEIARLVATQLKAEAELLRKEARDALMRMGPIAQEYLSGVRQP